jgi:hypothetical protein
MSDPALWWTLVEKGSLVFVFFGMTVLVLLGFHKKWLAPGWVLAEKDARIAALEASEAQWRNLALQSIGLSSRFAAVALPTGPFPPTPSCPTTPTGGG